MNESLIRSLLESARQLVFDPKSDMPILFSGASLHAILSHLLWELNRVEESPTIDSSPESIAHTWASQVEAFRRAAIQSAEKRESVVLSEGVQFLRIGEQDADAAIRSCVKGPGDYHPPPVARR